MTDPDELRRRAVELINKAAIVLRRNEVAEMEILDFGLGRPEVTGAQIVHIVDTDRLAVRLITLFPGQTEPEHIHPPDESGGKEETIRCAWGTLYLFGPGEPTPHPSTKPPAGETSTYTMKHEYILKPGDQVTFAPGTAHWFQAGSEGAVVWSFSTRADDVSDIFTDTKVVR